MNTFQNKSWWSRNWKWVVPVGCLGVLVLFAVSVSAILFLVFNMMKSSNVYRDAVAKVKAHQTVVNGLGQPIKEGLFVTGEINVSNLSGQANLAIPISGPKGKGTIYVEAIKSEGRWSFSTLVVEIKNTQQTIDILEIEQFNQLMKRIR